MLVAIDFDGTIVDFTDTPFTTNYTLKEHCKEVLDRLSRNNELILNTSRYGIRRLYAIHYIHKNKMPIKTPLLNRKVSADIYIDDKNLECSQIDWLMIEKAINERSNQNVLHQQAT